MMRGLAAAGCAMAVGVGTLLLVQHNPTGSLAGSSAAGSAALLGAGWLAIAAGLLVRHRRPRSTSGVLLAAGGFAWFIAEWNNPGAGSPLIFTVGLLLYAACPPLIAHAALSYPSGQLGSRIERWTLVATYAVSLGVLGLGATLVFSPGDQGCGQCATNVVAIASDARLVESLSRAGVQLGLACMIALAVLAAWRLTRSTSAARRVKASVLVPGVAFLAAVAATDLHDLHGRAFFNDVFARRLWIAQAVTLTLVALGAAWEWPRARRARSVIAEMVVELAQSPPAGGLRDALAITLGDPDLQIAYPIGEGQCVDARGVAIDIVAAPERATTALVREGETIALLAHRSDLLGDAGLVEESASAARLAFENERLEAFARAQLIDLHTSRVRLVAAADAERQRLERDLHDGAQQRLVGLTLEMRLMRSQLAVTTHSNVAVGLAAAEAELCQAVADLRQLASGIHPTVLTDFGLAAAIEALAESSTSPLRLLVAPEERFSPAAETAAYLVVAKASKVGAVTATAVHRDARLVVDVDAVRQPADLVDLEDRIGALDGTLRISPTPDGVHIRADIPCG